MIKKSIILLLVSIFIISGVFAQDYKLSISTTQETFEAGKAITFIVSLHDSNNNRIDDDVLVSFGHDDVSIENTFQSNYLSEITLEDKAPAGEWKIRAKYQGVESSSVFFIKEKEKLRFDINEDLLTITNDGNSKYSNIIQIMIGDTPGTKKIDLNPSESASYRLIAPEGDYEIKVISNGEIVFSKGGVLLKSKGLTGEAVGVLDEGSSSRGFFTGGISPDEDEALLSYVRNSKFVYVFVIVIFGAMILLAIERRYKKRAGK